MSRRALQCHAQCTEFLELYSPPNFTFILATNEIVYISSNAKRTHVTRLCFFSFLQF